MVSEVKKKLAKIEALKKSDKACPFCGYKKVKWLAIGIWYCKKCGRKFTSKAYTVSKKAFQKEATLLETQEGSEPNSEEVETENG